MSEANSDDRATNEFVTRYIVASDEHQFVGRVFDLSICSLHFDDLQEIEKYVDCKYVIDVNFVLTWVVQRVESLNLVGNMLWPEPVPTDFKNFPISRFDWLTVTADVFLMRYISVVDCAVLLVNEIYEIGVERKKCSIDRLKKSGVAAPVIDLLSVLEANQGLLRGERNARFHHGVERTYTDDDATFKMISIFENLGQPIAGHDRFGRQVDPIRSFKEGLATLQFDFNQTSKKLVENLNDLYDEVGTEFERRFNSKVGLRKHNT